jgi:signal peptidase
MDDDVPRSSAAHSKGARQGSQSVLAWARDIAVAVVAVVVVIGSIFAYSSTWPPMVVIESGSMMHADERSILGVIDTGDLTLVKKVDRRGDIVTYLEGMQTGYLTYGSFGDVIIYAANGHRGETPIIHRAICWLEFNRSYSPFSAGAPPSVLNSTWDLPDIGLYGIEVAADPSAHRVVSLGLIRTWHTGGETHVNLSIDLTSAAMAMGRYPHSGFITKGDNNGGPDQAAVPPARSLQRNPPDFDPHGSRDSQPVMFEWVVGRAQGELPWFGVIKLWAGGPNHGPIPGNSQTNLLLAIVVIAVGPFALEQVWARWGDRVTSRIPQRTKDKWHAAWDKLPGGKGRARRRREAAEEAAGRHRGGRRHGGRAR